MRRAFTLLEVLVGLALLATLGVWLLRIQTQAVRQQQQTQRRAAAAELVADLLWTWSTQHVAVTLPDDGSFSADLRWQRRTLPVVVAGVPVTAVRVVVTQLEPHRAPQELYRVEWLVPRARIDHRPASAHEWPELP